MSTCVKGNMQNNDKEYSLTNCMRNYEAGRFGAPTSLILVYAQSLL